MADERTDVAGLVERAFLMGLGVMEMTRERVTSMTNDDLIGYWKIAKMDVWDQAYVDLVVLIRAWLPRSGESKSTAKDGLPYVVDIE